MNEGSEITSYTPSRLKRFPKPENPTEELFWKEGDKVPPIEEVLDSPDGEGLSILLQHIMLFRHTYAEPKDRKNKLEQELKMLQKPPESDDKRRDCAKIQKEIDEIEAQIEKGGFEMVRPFDITTKEELFGGLQYLRCDEKSEELELWNQIASDCNILKMTVILQNALLQKQQKEKHNLEKISHRDFAAEDAAQQQIENIAKALKQLYAKMNKLNALVENAQYISNLLPFKKLEAEIHSQVDALQTCGEDLKNTVESLRGAVRVCMQKQTIVPPIADQYTGRKTDAQNDDLTSYFGFKDLLEALNEKAISTRETIGTNNGQTVQEVLDTIKEKQETLIQQMTITNALLTKLIQNSDMSNTDIRAIVESHR